LSTFFHGVKSFNPPKRDLLILVVEWSYCC
jgi:hypothetical protein